jgi:choline transport protein
MSIDDKENPEVVGTALANNDDVDRKGTAADREDMYRMGKTQEMRVRMNKAFDL